MKKVYLDSEIYKEPAEIHKYLQEELEFPEYYGKNLAALFDCVSDICEETTIRYRRERFSSKELEVYFSKVLMVLKDAAKENELLILEEVQE